MELTSASLVVKESEAIREEAPQSDTKKILMIASMVGLLAVGGYFIYSLSGASADSSEQLKNIKDMLGMGPKAGISRFIAPIVGALLIAAVSLPLLSIGGRDLEKAKEQSTKGKKEQGAKPAVASEAIKQQPEDLECNLTSYKLFFGPKDEPVPAETPAK